MQNVLDAPGGIRLSEVLPNGRICGGRDIRVTACCADSRRCRPGDLFIALVGDRHDGHDFADDAVRRGAAAVLAERLLPVNVPVCVVPDTREAFGHVCQGLAGRPSEPMCVIGVAGPGGKTTTSMLISSVLRAAARRAGTVTSLGYCDSVAAVAGRPTTPAPAELAQWMARMAANRCSHAVIEISRPALAQRQISGVQFDSIVLTAAPGDGWSRRGSTPTPLNAEKRLFQQLKRHGFAVVNTDHPAGRSFLPTIDKPSITVAMKTAAEVTGVLVERRRSEQTFLVTAGSQTVPVRTRMIGLPHVYNCLAASAVGLVIGVDLTTIVRGLESLEFLPGRLERIECGQPFGVFVDYADTPEMLSTALKTLRPVTRGRLVCVFGAGADRHKEQRPILGRVAEQLADLIIVTTDWRRREEPLRIIHDVLDGCARPSRAHWMPDRRAAIDWALSQVGSGDTLLVAGLDRCSQWRSDGVDCELDDREIIRRRLHREGATAGGYSAVGAWGGGKNRTRS